jgi:HEAT repeat protein
MGDRAVPSLVPALVTGNDRVRENAGLALAAMGPPAWPAVAPFLHDPSRRTRLAAARSLSGSGWTPPDVRDAVAFRSALGDWDAVAAMGGTAVPHLALALRDRHPAVREEMARALGRSGTTVVRNS